MEIRAHYIRHAEKAIMCKHRREELFVTGEYNKGIAKQIKQTQRYFYHNELLCLRNFLRKFHPVKQYIMTAKSIPPHYVI